MLDKMKTKTSCIGRIRRATYSTDVSKRLIDKSMPFTDWVFRRTREVYHIRESLCTAAMLAVIAKRKRHG